MRKRMRVVVAVAILVGAAQGALAMSQWWVPSGKSCPVFNDENSCEAYCREDSTRCGGSQQCVSKIGEGPPPECNDEP